MRYVDDGCIEINNSVARHALRGVALGHRNFSFIGAESAVNALRHMRPYWYSRLNGIDQRLGYAACWRISPTIPSFR